MSLSGSEGGLRNLPTYNYQDLEVDHIDGFWQIGAGQQDGTLNQQFIDGKPAGSWEPTGGLDRDEVAELVALKVGDCHIYVEEQAGAGTEPSSVNGISEVGSSPDPLTGFDASPAASDIGMSAATLAVDNNKDDIWTRVYARQASTAFNDTVNGSGGSSPAPPGGGYWMNFRSLGGEPNTLGPLMDKDDEVYHHISIGIDSNDTQNVNFQTNFQFYWYKHDVESSDLRDRILDRLNE